jgi:hypothetical protein
MSTGTATLFINGAISGKYTGDFQVEDLENRGRYYTGDVVSYEGKILARLLEDKQTGMVRFV